MANNFASTGCVALYRMESGGLTTDSIGTNTLTNSNVAESSGDFKEGSCCADFERSSSARLYRADTSLSSDFPFKSGDTTKQLSATCWFKMEALPTGDNYTLLSKWGSTWSYCSFLFSINTSGQIYLVAANASSAYDTTEWTKVLSAGQWYHIGFWMDGGTNSCSIRLWDDVLEETTDYTFDFAVSLEDGSGPFGIGYEDYYGYYFDGLMDEVAIFNRLLSNDEFDAIRQQTYDVSDIPVTGTATISLPFITDFAGTDENRRGECNALFPSPTFQANELYVGESDNEDYNTFPSLTMTGIGGMNHLGFAEMTFPAFEMVGSSNFAATYGAFNEFAILTMFGASGAAGNVTLPAGTMESTGHVKDIGESEIEFPVVAMEATGLVEQKTSGANTFKTASISASAYFSTVVGTCTHSFKALEFRASGGNKGRFDDYILQYSRW